jgi:hypothetical protein
VWIAMLLLILQAGGVPNGQSPCPDQTSKQNPPGAPALIVQVVDPTWLPISDADVTVKAEDSQKTEMKQATQSDGFAKFWLPWGDRSPTYTIRVKSQHFKEAVAEGIHPPEAGTTLPTVNVQLRLKVDPRGDVTVQ